MQFANPIWLWALSGLLIPIGIHLFSRKEGKVIPMGSLRYLRESPAARYKNIRLNERALLILRCLMVALLVFVLAGAKSPWPSPKQKKWLIIEREIEVANGIKQLIDELQNRGFESRSMSWGFPLLSGRTTLDPIDNYWTAVRQLTTHPLDSIVVLSKNYQWKFRGERIPLPPNMKWLIYPAEAKDFIAEKVSVARDSVWARKGNTSPLISRFQTIRAPSSSFRDSLPVTTPETLEILILSADEFAYDEKILVASINAIQFITPHKINIVTKTTEHNNHSAARIIFWLFHDPPPTRQGALTIAFMPCVGKNLPLLITSSEAIPHCEPSKNISLILTKRLNEEVALTEHLTLRLAELILPEKRNEEYDHRVLPEPMMWSSVKNHESQTVVKKESGTTDVLILALFLMVLVAERALAYNRNQ
jgi:hypothetical protein